MSSAHVIRLAEHCQLVTLKEVAAKVFERLDDVVEPDEGWQAAAPSWAGRGTNR